MIVGLVRIGIFWTGKTMVAASEFESNRTSKSIGVGYLPGRKRPCVYIHDRTVVRTPAYFTKDEDAEQFLRDLREFLNLDD